MLCESDVATVILRAHLSDSPSLQFRNRSIAAFVKRLPVIAAITGAAWHWLKSGHGKGLSDGVGWALKKAADNVVKSGVSIRSADEFVQQMQGDRVKTNLIHINAEVIDRIADNVATWDCPAVSGKIISTQ